MLMDKTIQIPEGQTQVHKKKGSKSPQKDPKQVFLYDVAPDMRFKIMFGANHNNAQCAHRKRYKGNAFPVPGGWAESSEYD